MYHQHPQGSQPFSNGGRPPPRQPPPNQHQTRSNMQVMGFQFPRPTQLPDELESALAIRGARDMDHRQIDHMTQPDPHQNQGSGTSQHGNFGSNPVSLPTDSQSEHHQRVDWSSYQPPAKLFAAPPPSSSHQSQQGAQQPQNTQAGPRLSIWTPSVCESLSNQVRHVHGASGEGPSLYTPESAGSILASFGLSNEDLEVLSHYPDDQLTPDTLPFILRDIQINKSGKQKTSASTSSSSFSHSAHDMPLPPSHSSALACSHSPEVPSLLTVTQTAGKVIDYGHASRTKDESTNMGNFKRELLSSERTVKMFPALSSSSATKVDKSERRQVHLEHTEPSKHGDSDYRRTSSLQRESSHSPGKELSLSPRSRDLDRDYRRDGTKQRLPSETRSDVSSKRSLSSSCGSKPHSSGKKLPTPTMISDFSAVSPKVYPHTCSLCHIVCDQEKDWVKHVNTVNHTAACRDLRNKYPGWKPNLPSRSGRYGSRALWDPKDGSPSRSMSHSLSRSPSPPSKKRRVDSHPFRPQRRRNSPQRYPQQTHDTEHRDRLKYRHTGSRSPSNMNRTFRQYWSARRDRVSTASFSRVAVKRPRGDSTKHYTDTSRDRASRLGGHGSKHGSSQPSTKGLKALSKHGPKTAKISAKPPPAKKKKKTVTPASQDSQSVANRLVYLTGIPEDASEQEVTDLVGAFGKINNVILMPCSEESEKGQGQKASVCMVKAEDAQALATSTNLSIREQHITASVAKKPEGEQSADANSKPSVEQNKDAAGTDTAAEGNTDQKTSSEKGRLLITGLPESGWSECDIINLIQPFGTPSDIILATQMGKALVSVPDMDVVQEMVKVHTFVPAKVKDCEVKLTPLKQHISFNTPVALYNLLMGPVDPLSRAPVAWNSLLVIGNVPDTPSGSSEVEKLVRRFGTVIKTLVLSSMVICEMATAAMALSVYKRFQAFPCIIQNNPLFFSRKPDPKASTQTKAITAPHDSPEDTPANGQAKQTSADREEAAHQDSSESPEERIEKHCDGDANKMTGREETVEEVLEACKDGNVEKDELTVCDSAPENQLEADTMGTSGIDIKTTEESKVSASEAEREQTPAEESQPPRLEGKADSEEAAELPKVTQAMVNALLVECRTGPTGHSSSRAAPPSGEKGENQTETKLGQKTTETKEMTKKQMGVEGEVKRQEKEKKDARKEKEVRERMKRQRERDRRGWEKEERAKREWTEKSRRERREEERREWERKERERRERKRAHGNGLSGSRLSSRSEGSRQSYGRDERHSMEAETKAEEELDEFPFDMSDFVTVDEVGDVAELPLERSEEGETPPTCVPQDTPQDAAIDVTAAPAKCELTPEGDVTADLLPSAAVSPPPASQAKPAHSPVHKPSEADITPQPAASSLAAERSQDGDEENPLKPRESVEEEKMGLVKQEEHLKVQDQENKDRRETAAETGKQEQSERNPNAEEESEKPKLEMEIPRKTEHSLPPFDPSNPVGMEFLVPKTGFFCKVCARFFSGSKEAEISHCKTRKHYETLQKYLKTSKTTSETAKPDSS
ncbi:zinc finger protein 638-like isoform X2 [Astatotilapia calliptera]|uniref:zinc finger protein 638-like isoform X2 n=1 Tax=Astatotilapia calliptera TaxID=8154 RepID=UPI000E3FAF09|nr:zinc finger protein 638-like isoform X2 [Astatotilapia calliptera]